MTGESVALLQKSKASLNAARMLIENGYFDFAASRAYYAMFYAAEALLADIGQSYSKHAAVIAAFGREFAKPGKLDPQLHRWLIDAQDLRNTGDYAVGPGISAEEAQTICEWAEKFIQAAETYLAEKESRDI